jgi:acetyltransferase-like isoleucine patch superfamily enzyme
MKQWLNRLFGKKKVEASPKMFYTQGEGSVYAAKEWVSRENAKFTMGDRSMFAGNMYFDREGAEVIIGHRTYVGGSLMCAHKIVIGDDVLISSGGGIMDHDSHNIDFELRRNDVQDYISCIKDWTHVPMKEIIIGNKVWIGYNVIILKGITIGDGAVIAAGAVITRDVEPFTLVGGNPARLIRKLN